MGIFFRSASVRSAVTPVLTTAFAADPGTVPDQPRAVALAADKVVAEVQGTFSWVRLVVALVLLALLIGAAAWTGMKPELKDLYTVLVHSVEIGLGGVFGLLLGEAATR